MTYSDRYKALIVAISQLQKDLLPGYFKKNANYSREYITRTIAYHILVHAEIESYFENRAWDIALTAIQKWKTTNKANRIILALIAFSGRTMEKPPNSIIPDHTSQSDHWDEKIRLNKKVSLAVRDFFYVVNNNHGIKETNLIHLLLPIGVNADEIDTVLIADLNSYGERRGKFAHNTSQVYSTTIQIDPKEEWEKAKKLIKNIASIDKLFNNLILEIK